MAHFVVVVESPAKAKTIEKYLGKQYKVMASYGHVRDLVPKEGAVDPDHDFAMKYQVIERNQKHVDAIAKAVKNCDGIYLAPDPDREGEAIAWHVLELLEERGVVGDKPVSRVVFHEITKAAIKNAVEHPRQISLDLVNAQQARRALDYLVGFNLSPLLWRKIRPGLSAGRVQSPALRMIVEREEEIEKFISREYWSIHAHLIEQDQAFEAHLIEYQGQKIEQFSVTDEKTAHGITANLTQLAQGRLQVTKVTKKARKRHPAAPFITSTLQQEAARKLGFTAQRTMQVAQQLYEGIDTGEGAVGLISYMRTDSVTLAQEAVGEIREYIAQRYGADQVPEEPRVYKSKSKNAQEAHEAIRPTAVSREPDQLQTALNVEQLKLYTLIWKRTVACQMIDATIDTVAVDLEAKDGVFRANGSMIVDPGFINVYQEGLDDKKKEEDEAHKMLPPLKEKQWVTLKDIIGEQHFTEPPPRYTEATLVKGLEERDIGRPSTYASIIATLKNREYVTLDSKRFMPTDVGRIVNRFLTQYFTQYVDYDFTARLEDELDDVARGDKVWVPVLEAFWKPFKHLVDETQQTVKRSDVTQEKTDEKCPDCGHPLVIRLGKRGRFIGCSDYPKCKYTRNVGEDASAAPAAQQVIADRKCPNDGGDLVIKQGPYGKFIGCSNYPDCHFLEPLEKPKDTQVECPECHQGHILQRKSRRGKIFYSCSRYPDCKYALWNEPIKEVCPNCKWPILTVKTTKKKGREKLCPQPNCGYTTPYPEEAE